jgi:Fe-S-cluster containining protein
MGKLTVNFSCVHCGHCCTDVICLPTPWDVLRIIRETGADPFDFLEFVGPTDISEVRKNDPTWLRCKSERHMMALRRGPKGCFFLDTKTRHCQIYHARPILCRLYPFKLHESRDGDFRGFSLHKDVGCPRDRAGVVATEPLYELYLEDNDHQNDYQDLVSVFNRRRDPGKRPEDFIAMFYEAAGARRKGSKNCSKGT